MTISNVNKKVEMGESGAEATFITRISYDGPADYGDGGTDETALLRAALGKNVTPIAISHVITIGSNPSYRPRIVLTPASTVSAATFPTADQDGNTIIYALNGGAQQALVLSGAHTLASQLAASLEAVAGLHAYVDGTGQVTAKTIKDGAEASLEIVGGTANAVFLFPVALNEGNDAPLLLVIDTAGADVAYGSASPVDLSGDTFKCVLFSE